MPLSAVCAQYNRILCELYVTLCAPVRTEASSFNADPADWFAVKHPLVVYVRLSSAVTSWYNSDHTTLLVHFLPAAH